MRGRWSKGKRKSTRWVNVPQSEVSVPPGYDFLSARRNMSEVQIHVQAVLEPDQCPVCRAELEMYSSRTPSFRDVNQGEYTGVIIVHRRQYMCCGPVRHFIGQPLPGIDTKRDMTVRLVLFIRNNPDLTNVKLAGMVGVSDKTVAGVHLDHAAEIENRQKAFDVYLALGWDEKRIDGVDYFVLVDLVTRTFISMLNGNDHETIRRELEQYKHRDRVGLIVIDMHNDYSWLARELFANAFVIYYAFHVMDKLDECREQVRIDAWKIATGDAKAMLRDRKQFWQSLDKPAAWDGQQSDLFQTMPSIMEAHYTYKAFLSFWRSARNSREATSLFDFWADHIPSAVEPYFEQFINAVNERRDEVFQYFETGATAGPTEAVNRNIQAELDKGRGYSYEGLTARMKVKDEVKRQRQLDALNGDDNATEEIPGQREVQMSTDGSLARSEKMRKQIGEAAAKSSAPAQETAPDPRSAGDSSQADPSLETKEKMAPEEAQKNRTEQNWSTAGSTLLLVPTASGFPDQVRCQNCRAWDAAAEKCTVSLTDCKLGQHPSVGHV